MPEVNWQDIIDGNLTVEDVINEIDIELGSIMNGTSYRDPFTQADDMKNYINRNLLNYTNSSCPDIINYFIWKYRL